MNQRLVNIIEAFLLQNVGSKDLQEDARRTLKSHASAPTREVTEEYSDEEIKQKSQDFAERWIKKDKSYDYGTLCFAFAMGMRDNHATTGGLDLNELERKLDESLDKETADRLKVWLKRKRVKSLSNPREVEGEWISVKTRLPKYID